MLSKSSWIYTEQGIKFDVQLNQRLASSPMCFGILLHEMVHIWDETTWKPVEPNWSTAGHGHHWNAKAEQVVSPNVSFCCCGRIRTARWAGWGFASAPLTSIERLWRPTSEASGGCLEARDPAFRCGPCFGLVGGGNVSGAFRVTQYRRHRMPCD